MIIRIVFGLLSLLLVTTIFSQPTAQTSRLKYSGLSEAHDDVERAYGQFAHIFGQVSYFRISDCKARFEERGPLHSSKKVVDWSRMKKITYEQIDRSRTNQVVYLIYKDGGGIFASSSRLRVPGEDMSKAQRFINASATLSNTCRRLAGRKKNVKIINKTK